MAQNNARRGIGTILMGLGLLLILVVGGYFVWSDIESARVRAGLRGNVSAAADAAAPAATSAAAQSAVPAAVAATATRTAPPSTPTVTARATEAATVTRAAPRPTSTQPAGATGLAAATATPTRRPATATAAATPVPPAQPLTQNPPVRMTIPDLKIDAQVVPMGWEVVQTKNGPVSQWVIPKSAAGHHINSAGLGETGNLVISGHNNIFGQVFKPISLAWDNDARIKVDDFTDRSDILTGRTIELYAADGTKYTYQITDFLRLKDTGVSQQQRITNGEYILPTEDERVTIVTCWPPTNNTHRLIVIAQPAE